mmetsp:Transcript_57033/g.167001  ORF Transcript_57033/g.167001 Transcript_57033/m.167001 type:complete len:219 (+) Transcript_57033:388-1044(+)
MSAALLKLWCGEHSRGFRTTVLSMSVVPYWPQRRCASFFACMAAGSCAEACAGAEGPSAWCKKPCVRSDDAEGLARSLGEQCPGPRRMARSMSLPPPWGAKRRALSDLTGWAWGPEPFCGRTPVVQATELALIRGENSPRQRRTRRSMSPVRAIWCLGASLWTRAPSMPMGSMAPLCPSPHRRLTTSTFTARPELAAAAIIGAEAVLDRPPAARPSCA